MSPASRTAPSKVPLHPETPAFVIGVSGNRDPYLSGENLDLLRERLRNLFRFFRSGSKSSKQALSELCGCHLRQLGLENWQGVGAETQIVLLSSLAPGIDQIAVEVAREDEFRFNIQCPLPYPSDLYGLSSCFKGVPGVSDEELKARYEVLLSGIGEESTFLVYCDKDLNSPRGQPALDAAGIKSLKERMRREIEDDQSKASRIRYRAAGEYIAAYCHILLAVTDAEFWPDDDPRDLMVAGAHRIIEVKQRGVTPDLLPVSGSFNWTDNGPTFHLHHPRQKSKNRTNEIHRRSHLPHCSPITEEEKRNDTHRGLRELRVLYPYDSQNKTKSHSEPWHWKPVPAGKSVPESAAQGGAVFCRSLFYLSRFNREQFEPAPKENELKKALEAAKVKYPQVEKHVDSLYPLIDTRSRAARGKLESGKSYRDKNDRLFIVLLVGAFFSAMLFQLFANWNVDFDGDIERARWWRLSFGTAGLLGTLILAIVFWRHQLQDIEPRVFDYRALAEGLRVQIYWSMAGLSGSVAANYMQRQRGELSWIRSAISSLSFPYERFAKSFAHLDCVSQLRLFEVVREFWFEEQKDYFKKKAKEGRKLLKLNHRAGVCLAMAGLLQVLVVGWIWFGDGSNLVNDPTFSRPFVLGVALSFVIFLLLGGTVFDGFDEKDIRALSFPSKCWAVFSEVFNLDDHSKWTRRPSAFEAPVFIFEGWKRIYRFAPVFMFHFLIAFWLAALGLGLVLFLARLDFVPSVENRVLILMGSFFVASALVFAQAERSLLSETTYQYATMAGMFNCADLRLKDLLERMHSALDRGDDRAFGEMRKEVQLLLLAVGKEALDENAEWLILHRARPLDLILGN